tara:strand:- start:497 stop:787 length:291 start_codon:yes stop_codon:yes gene_type:complete
MSDIELYYYLAKMKKQQKEKINKFRKDNDVRCKNCKCKMRGIKNDFVSKELCKTCWKLLGTQKLYYDNRTDIYGKNEKGKWVKNKYKKKDWWYLKV